MAASCLFSRGEQSDKTYRGTEKGAKRAQTNGKDNSGLFYSMHSCYVSKCFQRSRHGSTLAMFCYVDFHCHLLALMMYGVVQCRLPLSPNALITASAAKEKKNSEPPHDSDPLRNSKASFLANTTSSYELLCKLVW